MSVQFQGPYPPPYPQEYQQTYEPVYPQFQADYPYQAYHPQVYQPLPPQPYYQQDYGQSHIQGHYQDQPQHVPQHQAQHQPQHLLQQRPQHQPQYNMQGQKQRHQQEPPITDRYKIIRPVGHSSEGSVTLVQSKTSGKLRVLKVVKIKGANEYPQEASMLRDVGPHPNVLRMLKLERDNAKGIAIMRMEHCSGGDLLSLQNYYHARNLLVPSAVILKALIDVIGGLAFIHGGWVWDEKKKAYEITKDPHRDLIHRDIKPENIFIRVRASADGGPPNYVFVIGDL